MINYSPVPLLPRYFFNNEDFTNSLFGCLSTQYETREIIKLTQEESRKRAAAKMEEEARRKADAEAKRIQKERAAEIKQKADEEEARRAAEAGKSFLRKSNKKEQSFDIARLGFSKDGRTFARVIEKKCRPPVHIQKIATD